jgi:hypothetical protein
MKLLGKRYAEEMLKVQAESKAEQTNVPDKK